MTLFRSQTHLLPKILSNFQSTCRLPMIKTHNRWNNKYFLCPSNSFPDFNINGESVSIKKYIINTTLIF